MAASFTSLGINLRAIVPALWKGMWSSAAQSPMTWIVGFWSDCIRVLMIPERAESEVRTCCVDN